MAKAEMKLNLNTKEVEKFMKSIIKKHENINKEKIAFSLFIMFYYKHDFCFENDEYLNKITLEKLKQTWELGKMKGKLKYFFSLADKVWEMNFNNNEEDEKNGNNRNNIL